MPNDSSTGGYLVSTSGPIYDSDLQDKFWELIVGITGLDPSLVRPRFEIEPSNMPSFDKSWIAFSVSVVDQDTHAYQTHDPTDAAGLGSDSVARDEYLELFCSYYGPAGHSLMSSLRDGLQIAQNREILSHNQIGFIDFGHPIYLPALLKEQNVKRVDVKSRFIRRTQRIYSVRSVLSATAAIENEKYSTTINITN